LSGLLGDGPASPREVKGAIAATSVDLLSVLPAGPAPLRSGDVLASPGAKTLFAALCDLADVVVVDAPPLLAGSDAGVLARLADGVVIVLRRSHSRRDEARQAREQLDTVHARTVGVVLTGVSVEEAGLSHFAEARG
jgi:non-specific protein-tyrosine kinase